MVSNGLNRRELIKAGLIGTTAVLYTPAFSHASSEVQQLDGRAFGTRWRVLLSGDADRVVAQRIIEDAIEHIDHLMSAYRVESEISSFNRRIAGSPCVVSADMATILKRSRQIAQQSQGAFDPGVGPLVHRYGFGPIDGQYVPFLDAIHQHGATVTKLSSEATIDLCGIAKGFAIDRITHKLARTGLRDVLVEVGGEFATLGTHPSGRDWRVAVENPNAPRSPAIAAVRLGDRALATSGHRHQGVRDPVSVTHIIAPHTGQPVDQKVLSVSVIADTAMDADAWSTALCALPPDKAVSLANHVNLDALIVLADLNGNGPRATRTGQFTRHEVFV